MKKLDSVKITQISTACNDSQGLYITGLGDDQNTYMWNYKDGVWVINRMPAAAV